MPPGTALEPIPIEVGCAMTTLTFDFRPLPAMLKAGPLVLCLLSPARRFAKTFGVGDLVLGRCNETGGRH